MLVDTFLQSWVCLDASPQHTLQLRRHQPRDPPPPQKVVGYGVQDSDEAIEARQGDNPELIKMKNYWIVKNSWWVVFTFVGGGYQSGSGHSGAGECAGGYGG